MLQAFFNSPGIMTFAIAAVVVTGALVLRVLRRHPWR
jgi:hypothetical protein